MSRERWRLLVAAGRCDAPDFWVGSFVNDALTFASTGSPRTLEAPEFVDHLFSELLESGREPVLLIVLLDDGERARPVVAAARTGRTWTLPTTQACLDDDDVRADVLFAVSTLVQQHHHGTAAEVSAA